MSSQCIFGTDGIRGEVNRFPVTAELMFMVGLVSGKLYGKKVAIGRDTRLSCCMIETALIAGLLASGAEVMILECVPTGFVSMYVASSGAMLGLMVSASHSDNTMNGLKFFDQNGYKLTETQEQHLSQKIKMLYGKQTLYVLPDAPKVLTEKHSVACYIRHLHGLFPKIQGISKLKIVLDCAHGVMSDIAARVLEGYGCEVLVFHDQPNGSNINTDSGTLCVERVLAQHVVKNKADLGLAFDGDGDRLIVCDKQGGLIDGDQMLAYLAWHWSQSKLLGMNGVVCTTLSNTGLVHFLKAQGIRVYQSCVGEKYVVATMREKGCLLGGEKSGHLIMLRYCHSSDGLMTAFCLLEAMSLRQETATEVRHIFKPFPQVCSDIHCKKKNVLDNPKVQGFVARQRAKLGEEGRIMLRYSGTDPVIRLMVEARSLEQVESMSRAITRYLVDFQNPCIASPNLIE